MRRPIAFLPLIALAALFWALNTRLGTVPPLGKFLDPFGGFLRNGAAGDEIPEKLAVPGLRAQVTVVWDDRHVAHIFAANEADLYRTQGYLTARDRLWQMEFLSRYTGGRLAEIIGGQAVGLDRLQRRLGLTWGAENFLKGLGRNPAMRRVLDEYCEGVNAYVRSLRPAEYPLEYKVLDYAPEEWTPLDTALILKYMAWYLSGEGNDLGMTRTRAAIGEAETDRLFPFHAPFQDPVIPAGTSWDFPAPGAAAPSSLPAGLAAGAGREREIPDDPVGSNNWAVSGRKSRSGFPILCGDPHLQLTLPSIWYEVQLGAPGLNVRGVSLPGAPGVIIGFNEKVAWSMTNAGSDVLDFYQMKFRDARRREYAWGEGWRKTSLRRERIRVRDGKEVIENVLYTHLGPVPFPERGPDQPEWIPAAAAMRWAGHDAGTILHSLYVLDRAQGYGDFEKAMAEFDCPAQNVAYAGSDGRIAIWHNGKFPLRSRGQGRYILDGSSPADEWGGWLPMERVPHMADPERGFVSSANQSPADSLYPYYLGWDYGGFERGARINEILAAAPPLTPEDMALMQGDALSLRARTILPRLLEILAGSPQSGEARERAAELGRWDFVYRADRIEPTLFHVFWDELYRAVWDDEFEAQRIFAAPGADRTMELILSEPGSPYFDDRATPARESLGDIVRQAFERALGRLREERGAFGPAWRWGQARPVTISHLGRIPGLGAPPLAVSGGRGVINAASRAHGPSWRMVVEMGPTVRAWGILPGGASGNPGSRYYDDGIPRWAEGKVFELLFLKSAEENDERIAGRTRLGGGR
jgi:penicillin amidase